MDWDDEFKAMREADERRVDDEKSKALTVMAAALEKSFDDSIEAVSTACVAEISKWCCEVGELAKTFGPEAHKGFGVERVINDLKWEEGDTGFVVGLSGVSTGNYIMQRRFRCRPEEAPAMAAKAALRAMMERHGWLSDGFDVDAVDEQSPEAKQLRAFLLAAPSLGVSGVCLAQMAQAEARWSHERWKAQVWIEDMVKHSARAGLMPGGFAGSRIILYGGWPGEPTEVSCWEVRPAASFGGRGPSALESRDEKDCGGEDALWRLPSLDAGPEALWRAFCDKVAWAQSRGWSSLSESFSAPRTKMACKAAVEARLIAEESGSAPAPRGPRRSI